MLAAFKRHGWRVLGNERSEDAAAYARAVYDVDVVTTPIELMPLSRTFDLIVMFNALEHMTDPIALLRECRQRLAPGGRVMINVPNFASWQRRFAGSKWLHLDAPRHLQHFSPDTLAETLGRAGLGVESIDYVSFEHDPYGWVESLNNRVTRNTNVLTRYLMGLDPMSAAVMGSAALACVAGLPAILLSAASWYAGAGAIMQVSAVALNADRNRSTDDIQM
jgi:SAM-dependent methyltransferase